MLYFKTGSSAVEGRFNQLAADFIEKTLASNSKARFFINGHADRAGTELKSHRLSAQRANRVAQLFARRNKDQLCGARSYGSKAPYFYSALRHKHISDRRVELRAAESTKDCVN